MKNKILFIIFLTTSIFSFSFLYSDADVDFSIWLKWMENVETHGIDYGYEVNNDMYPPFSNVIFYFVSLFSKVTGFAAAISLKIFLFAFLLSTSFIILYWSKSLMYATISQAAFILNAMALSYIDIFTAPFILVSLYALYKKKYILFTIFFFINVMIKWQAIILLPFILIYLMNISSFTEIRTIEWKKIAIQFFIPALILFFTTTLVFGNEIYASFDRAINEDMFSGFALNFNWIATRIFHLTNPSDYNFYDGIMRILSTNEVGISVLSKTIFTLLFLSTLIAYFFVEKSFLNFLKFSVIGFLVYFSFNTGVHENHLFVAALLALIIPIYDEEYIPQTAGIILAFNINMYFFFGAFGYQPNILGNFGADISAILSFLFVLLFMIIYAPVVSTLSKIFWKE